MTDLERLQELIDRRHACIYIPTYDEDEALQHLRQVALTSLRPLHVWSVSGGVQAGLAGGGDIFVGTEAPADAFRHFLGLQGAAMCVMLDLVPHLPDARSCRALRNFLNRIRESDQQLFLIDHDDSLPAVVARHATRFELSLPDEEELQQIVRQTLQNVHRQQPIRVQLSRSELRTVLRNLRGLSRRQAARIIADVARDDRTFDESDINRILARKRQALHHGGLLEYVETPVNLDDIGGLRRLKHWLQQRARAFEDEARTFGLTTPRGVLMLGVQGAGKSLCAKAIATAWQRPLLRMDPGALYDRYVGESERRLRDALRQAESMAPIILWIDEIEKAFASSASRSTDGGLSQRMFGTLLTWMQEHRSPVFLVATANDIEALPPELLRKGRFDEIFFVDLPPTEVRRLIFGIHLRQRRQDPTHFDLDALAAAAAGFSGAEIEQAVVAALHVAYGQQAALTTADLLEAIQQSPPLSVTMAERVAALRAWSVGRCVPADE